MLRTLPIRSYLLFVLGVSSTSILDIKCISATMPSIDVLRSSFVSSRDNLINFLFKRILLSVVSGGSGMLSAEQRANEKKNVSKVADSRLTLSLPLSLSTKLRLCFRPKIILCGESPSKYVVQDLFL